MEVGKSKGFIDLSTSYFPDLALVVHWFRVQKALYGRSGRLVAWFWTPKRVFTRYVPDSSVHYGFFLFVCVF